MKGISRDKKMKILSDRFHLNTKPIIKSEELTRINHTRRNKVLDFDYNQYFIILAGIIMLVTIVLLDWCLYELLTR